MRHTLIGRKYSYGLDNIGTVNSSADHLNNALLTIVGELKHLSNSLYQRIKIYITEPEQQTKVSARTQQRAAASERT